MGDSSAARVPADVGSPQSAHTTPAPELYVVCDASLKRKCSAAVVLTSEGRSFTSVATGRSIPAAEALALAAAVRMAADMSDRHQGRTVVVYTDQLHLTHDANLLPQKLLQTLRKASVKDRRTVLEAHKHATGHLDDGRVVVQWMQAHPRLRPAGDEYGHRELMDRADDLAAALASGEPAPAGESSRESGIRAAAGHTPVLAGKALRRACESVIVPGPGVLPAPHGGPQAVLVIRPHRHKLAALGPTPDAAPLVQRLRQHPGVDPLSHECVDLAVRHAICLVLADLGRGRPHATRWQPTGSLIIVDHRQVKRGPNATVMHLHRGLRSEDPVTALISRAYRDRLALEVFVTGNKKTPDPARDTPTSRLFSLIGL